MSQKLKLFEEKDTSSTLKVNKKFAEKFEARKRREEIQRIAETTQELEDSEESSEDSEAELLTQKANSKFLKALSMIKNRDPRLKDPNFQLFSDSDFEDPQEPQKPQNKKLTYKEVVTKNLLGNQVDNAPTQVQKQESIKNDFLQAVNEWETQDSNNQLLKPREKTAEEINKEKQELEVLLQQEKDSSELKKLKEYWEQAETPNEEFLKKFFLKKMWKDEDTLLTYDEIVDQEDQTREEEFDNFESSYNFRFEEEGFDKIQTYSRQVEGSVRQKPEKRKEKRQAKQERKELEKVKKAEEIKRLKNLKKQEIMKRMELINNYAGKTLKLNEEVFEEDFDPHKHDQLMKSNFDEDYYQESESCASDSKPEQIEENQVDIEKIEKSAELPQAVREGGSNDWWLCDGCQNGIPENSWRFDCSECDNFTLCNTCRTTVSHSHRLKKLKVPIGCKPPDQVDFVYCDGCNKDITSKLRYDCSECQDFSVCEDCQLTVEHPHELKSAQDLWEEYYNLDYEELIEDIPCKFRYRQVEPNDYGLDVNEILEWDDKTLNSYIGIKKLAPYREDQGKTSINKLKKKKKYLKTLTYQQKHTE